MKKFITISLNIFLIFFVSTASYPQSHKLADQYYKRGKNLEKQGRYLQAAQMHEKSAEAEKKSRNPRLSSLAAKLDNAGYCYRVIGQYDKALKYYEEALVINKRLGEKGNIAFSLNNIGLIYNFRGQYDKALKNYEEALGIDRKLKRELFVAVRLNNIGKVYTSWGKYDEALAYYTEALAIHKKLGKEGLMAIVINNIAGVYFFLGQYDKAINNHKEALSIARKLGNDSSIARSLNDIGMVYKYWGKYDEALKYYTEALAIEKKSGKEGEISADLSNIAALYLAWGQYNKAIEYAREALAMDRKMGREGGMAIRFNIIASSYSRLGQYDEAITYQKEALAIEKKLGREGDVAVNLNNIGLIYRALKQYDKAINNFNEALIISRKLGREANVAANLANIGLAYYDLEKHDKAIANFKASVELKEKLRKTATGDVRRDYLASQIITYQYLISTFLRNNDLSNAFSIIELSRAKLLAERLATSESEVIIPSVKQIQEEVPEDTAVLVYANVMSGLPIVQIVITKSNIYGMEISDQDIVTSVLGEYEAPISKMLMNQRGIAVIKKEEEREWKRIRYERKIHFDDIIDYYRKILANPSLQSSRGLRITKSDTASYTQRAKGINNMLYDFLVKPLVENINNKRRLIIIPDANLNFLPFETLVDENGKYLVESYDISYAQSMGVLDLIKKRKYETARMPLLAFGGAVYDEVAYRTDMIVNERQLNSLKKDVYASIENRGSVRDAYAALALARWTNLPGTLSEVKNIKEVVSRAKIYTGKEATENTVKELSRKRDLANYKVIHFATHGLVVPALPELSAIVLSQFKVEKGGEDGYLRMGEIAELDINADFVNLSACETGLGKIYGGEGVVGLTQSFLIAGANGLSVSLWQVADVSTSQFMVALYRLAEGENIGYDAAINVIKRRFIKGDFGASYTAPYYWAPFVYYGI